MIVDRRCRAGYDDENGWTVLELLDDAPYGDVPRRVLPCGLLAKLEELGARRPRPVFRVSGETTVYKHNCYILLRKLVIDSRAAEAVGSASAPVSVPGSAPATAPARTHAEGAGASRSDRILKELLRERPGKPVALPGRPDPKDLDAVPSVVPVGPKARRAAGGTMAVDRIVRVLPEGPDSNWLVARFESDNTLQEPPARLLPCATLAEAARLGGRLKVTGEFTHYRGRRYLLLRKVFRFRDMRQF
jgi:hypothetical protein